MNSMGNPKSFLFASLFLLQAFHLVIASENASTYIVHMDKSTMPTEFSTSLQWHTAVLGSLSSSTPPALLYSYDNAIHGFSALLSPSHLESLKNFPGFLSAYRDMKYALLTTHTPTFLKLSSVSGIWPASDYGEGVIVGMIDSGVWPESRSFRDDGLMEIPARWKGECQTSRDFNSSMCNRKLIGARYYNKGFTAAIPLSVTPSSRDTEGHGSHTASTAAGSFVEDASSFNYASGTASGMAPRARLAVYKVVWHGFALASDVLAAMDDAITDGVDIMSISLGRARPSPFYEDPIAIAAFSAMDKGIFVSCAAGNYGPLPSTVSNDSPWMLAVGASTIDRQFAGTVTLGDRQQIIGTTMYPDDLLVYGASLVYNESDTFCLGSLETKQLANVVIVCQTKLSVVSHQLDLIASSAVAGALLVSNDSLLSYKAPVIVITPNESVKLFNYIMLSAQPNASLSFQQTIIPGTRPAPAVDYYSSRGPSRTNPGILKPDITAPGTMILAAWPSNIPAGAVGSRSLLSDFMVLTGTSMACPHAAGVVALLKGVHPDWSPAAMRSAMMTTADILDNTHGFIKDMGNGGKPATPLAIGSGSINPNKAMDPGLIYDANSDDYINFLCNLNYTVEQIKTIIRSLSFNCSKPSQDLNYPSFTTFFPQNTSKTLGRKVFTRTVTNVGDGPATYYACVESPKGVEVIVQPAKLQFTKKYEKLSFTVSIGRIHKMKDDAVYGYLTWTDDGEKHVVRSPIVVTTYPVAAS